MMNFYKRLELTSLLGQGHSALFFYAVRSAAVLKLDFVVKTNKIEIQVDTQAKIILEQSIDGIILFQMVHTDEVKCNILAKYFNKLRKHYLLYIFGCSAEYFAGNGFFGFSVTPVSKKYYFSKKDVIFCDSVIDEFVGLAESLQKHTILLNN